MKINNLYKFDQKFLINQVQFRVNKYVSKRKTIKADYRGERR